MISYIVYYLLIGIIWGLITLYVGKKKNINGFWWGFALWFIGLIVVIGLPDRSDNGKNEYHFFKNRINIFVGIVVLVLAIVGIIVTAIFFDNVKMSKTNMETSLKEMGKDFYENFYYDLVVKDHGKDQISKFKDVGIKVDLDNLERYKSDNSEKVKDFVNPKTKEACNKNETKVIIYPEDPYEKTNYRLETVLSCGFEENK